MLHTASEARANLYRLIDQVVESHEPVRITGKRGTVLLVVPPDPKAPLEQLELAVTLGT